jgi:HlyD family secretion protein
MHPNPRRIVPIVLALVAAAALGYWYFGVHLAQDGSGALSASGTIEITQVQIGPELGGKVIEVPVAEGSQVKQGQVLFQLDATLLRAQRAQAAAGLEAARATAAAADYNLAAVQASEEAAQASLDLLNAGAPPEQLAAAAAQLAQAEASRQAAEAVFAALTYGARPEDVTAARQRLDQARVEYTTLMVVLTSDQIDAATTARAAAQSNLERAKTRLEDLRNNSAVPAAALTAASAAIDDAGAADQAAQAALSAARDAKLPLFRQIEAARSSWETAQLALSQAKARETLLIASADMPQVALDAARADVDTAQQLVDDAQQAYDAINTSSQGDQLRAAWNEAQAALSALNGLGRGTGAGVETVLNQVDAAAAMSDFAGANLSAAQKGARSEQVAAAQAQLSAASARTAQARSQADAVKAQMDGAQAALDVLDVQIGKLTITAPVDGVVMTLVFQPGEIAAPGALMMVLGQTEDKTITVYIPEDRYGKLSIGQGAQVSVDSFPGQKFQARVARIADKAEFTPRNVQTAAGRKNTVFAIKLEVVDADGLLRAGMPADVVFDPD